MANCGGRRLCRLLLVQPHWYWRLARHHEYSMGLAPVPRRRGRATLVLRWAFVMSRSQVAFGSQDVCDLLFAWGVLLESVACLMVADAGWRRSRSSNATS
jgi:hypothetical protein